MIGQTSQYLISGPAGQVVRSHEVFVAQVILPKIDVIGINLPHHVAVRLEELVEVAEQEVGEDVDSAILELNEAHPLPSQVILQTLQDQVLGTFHVELQEINVINPLLSEKVVPPHHRALDPLTGPAMG